MPIRQFVKFSIVGFSNFLIDAIVFGGLRSLVILPELAKALSFVFAASWSYYFNRRFTFRSNDPEILRQYMKFFAVSVFGFSLNTLSFTFFLRFLGLPEFLSFIGASATVAFWNFFANKLWTFRS